MYPPGVRTSNDIDLLVLRKDLPRIIELFRNHGFVQGFIRNERIVEAQRREIVNAQLNRGEIIPFVIGIEDEIQILENQFTYVDEDTEVTCHVDQYKMMEPGKEYILYLCYSEQDEWYYLLSGLQGKVPVSEEEEILFPASQITYYENQPKMEEGSEMQRVMEEIRKDSLEKYN